MERVVKFEALGQEFFLNTDAPEDEVAEILEIVHHQLEKSSHTTNMLPAKLGVLVSLNIAGKYVRLKKEFERYESEQNDRVSNLIGKIETVL